MTVETVSQTGPLAFDPTPAEAISAALEQWVGGMAASVRGAEYIVDTPMCPDSFWPLPAGSKSKAPKQMLPNEDRESYLARRQVATYTLGSVVRYGLQLGLPPEVAVQGIFTIGGRMSMYAEQMVALIKSRGHGHRVIERTRERCTVEVRRSGTSEWLSFTFTFEDAVTAGYVPDQGPNVGPHGNWPDGKPKKSPGNEKYLTDPATMLYARASSIACRTEFPDVLRGLVTAEEMQDEQRAPVEVHAEVVDRPARPSAASILAAPTPAPEPQPEPAAPVVGLPREIDLQAGATLLGSDAPAPAVEVQRYVLPVSKGQLDALKVRFDELGLGGRAAVARSSRMRVLSEIVSREIADPRDLTNDEGRLCVDSLAGEAGVRLVGDLFAVTAPAAPAVDEPAADPYADYDPSLELDGAEAAAEGR
jgi:hypothetical protein